ncbi:TIGR01244 family sulfur transferase [Phenylobacterium sp.]|uniref:TIGR01244 family sulfur transferase n=1 Tax=Phenylobacterium sp. TaxID=1871053 RepID=UPI003568DC04
MTDFRHVTDELSVAPQISAADVAEAKAQGFVAIICNRPDGEDPGQPTAAEIAAAAEAAGLTYAHIPVRGAPGPAEVEAMRQAVDAADGPVLAYCRSGTRSITTWSIGQAMSGAHERGELVALGRAAGYDLSGVLGG